jgi:prohibitin 2
MQDKLSTVVRAEGEAQSAKLLSETIKERPEFLQLRKIEAARDIAHMLAKSQNRIYLSSDSLLLNLATNTEKKK